jgi:UDP-N-acetylglucosamine 3-dehydrogenase
MLKVGIIGVRSIGNLHADCYQSSPHAQVVAVCDIIPERADSCAARLNSAGAQVRAYYNMHEMLANEELDLVDVSTGGKENGGDHYAPVMAALEAGKHVLCEKPISNNIERAREMVARARERGVCFAINLNYRFTPICRTAKRWIEEGRLGEVNFANKALWIANSRDDEWFHMRALHPHSIDVLRYLLGEIRYVHAFMKRSAGRTCWSNASINLKFESGVVGHLTGSYDMTTRHPMERTEVAGTAGRLVIENVMEDLWLYPHASDEVVHIHNSIHGGIKGFDDTFRLRIHAFCEQVDGGAAPEDIEGSGAHGLAAQEVIEAAIRSHQAGQVVEVS